MNGASVVGGFTPANKPGMDIPVTLVARDMPFDQAAVIVDAFDVSTDASFTKVTSSASAVRAASGETSVQLSLNAGTYYWRVRATAGDAVGPYSAVQTFTASAPPEDTALSAAPPTLVAPADGAVLDRYALVFVMQAASHSANFVTYQVETSRDPGFNPASTTLACVNTGGITDRQSCFAAELSPGVYYWRARADVVPTGSTLGAGYKGPYSAVRRFTVSSAAFNCCVDIASPPPITHNPVTLSVHNYTHPSAAAVAYQFTLSTIGDGSYSSDPSVPGFVATGTAPEGAAQTSWTVPLQLPTGTPFSWYVRAVDTTTGELSSPAGGHFQIAPAVDGIYSLTVTRAQDCPASLLNQYSGFATSGDAFGATRMAFQGDGTLSISLSKVGATYSGVIGGADPSNFIAFQTTATDKTPPPTTATLSGGVLTGAFDGYVSGRSVYGDPGACSGHGFVWTLSPVP